MTALYLVLVIPFIGMVLQTCIGHRLEAGRWNIFINALVFLATLGLAIDVSQSGSIQTPDEEFRVDAFNVYLVVLTAFVGLTTSIFSVPYMANEVQHGRVTARRMRLYHAMYQGFMLAMYLVLTTNNMGFLWVSMEGATLATVLLVSLYRTPEAIEAAWKYFILCGVGIAQALFGTVLMYFTAMHIPDGHGNLHWSILFEHAKDLNPSVMELAFVFLLVGYGTKVGLVPLHQWLPDAHSEGPTPMSAILSGLLLNDALYAIVRCKMLTDGATNSPIAGYLMMGFGLVSFLVAALFLHRQKDIKRLFSYSSIEHMGLMTFAFGLGGPLATFAALMHMTVHSLTKSALFVTVGHASQIAKTQQLERIRGLIRTQPSIGWTLLIGTIAIAGFPPFGVFTSEFLVLTATLEQFPWIAPFLLIGVGIAFAGLFRYIQPVVYGPAPVGHTPVKANLWPVFTHLALVLWLGLGVPSLLAHWFGQATQAISGSSPL